MKLDETEGAKDRYSLQNMHKYNPCMICLQRDKDQDLKC